MFLVRSDVLLTRILFLTTALSTSDIIMMYDIGACVKYDFNTIYWIPNTIYSWQLSLNSHANINGSCVNTHLSHRWPLRQMVKPLISGSRGHGLKTDKGKTNPKTCKYFEPLSIVGERLIITSTRLSRYTYFFILWIMFFFLPFFFSASFTPLLDLISHYSPIWDVINFLGITRQTRFLTFIFEISKNYYMVNQT